MATGRFQSRDGDTIAAISTPVGLGGIAVLRVSGPQALQTMRKLAEFLPQKPESHRVYHGKIKDLKGEIVDDVLLTYFAAGRSYSGDETVEISCHGNPLLAQKILDEVRTAGARMAEPGEFTYRAFMHGKLDLTQAEAVLDLIESNSDSARRQALRQLGGNVSLELRAIEEELIWCLAHLEAGIDFSTEGIEIIPNLDLEKRFFMLQSRVQKLRDSYSAGRIQKNGVHVAIIGEPNVGKSSLLNALVGENRAIVTEIAGTTRDVVNGEYFFKGLKFLLSDTAGLRSTNDPVERIGVERATAEAEIADLIFFVFDASKGLLESEVQLLAKWPQKTVLKVGNKSDLLGGSDPQMNVPGVVMVSSLHGTGIEGLKMEAWKRLNLEKFENESVISRARHFANLEAALENLGRGGMLLKQGMSNEFIALELKEALVSLQEVLGKRFDDEILDRVFKEFCIGK